jgi:hypothetical protein
MALTSVAYLWFISKLSSVMPSEQHLIFAEDHYGEFPKYYLKVVCYTGGNLHPAAHLGKGKISRLLIAIYHAHLSLKINIFL